MRTLTSIVGIGRLVGALTLGAFNVTDSSVNANDDVTCAYECINKGYSPIDCEYLPDVVVCELFNTGCCSPYQGGTIICRGPLLDPVKSAIPLIISADLVWDQ